ncbi:MAG: NAD(P)-dependent oxidoreductase, partial [Pseudomonadota bacterium]
MKRLLITGAAGNLGRMTRARLGFLAETLRLSDLAEMAPAGVNEEVVQCDLADFAAVRSLVADCDGIVHLGGISVEDTFQNILNGNLIGLYNIYEASRQAGVKRLMFASSNHAIGFHTRETMLDAVKAVGTDRRIGV